MRQLLVAVLLAVSPVIVAYSGTFRDDFSDGNLEGWHTGRGPAPPLPSPHRLKIENGYLVMDSFMAEPRPTIVSLELRPGKEKKWERWDSYTLTCRVRFTVIPQVGPPGTFYIEVRRSEGDKVQKGCCNFFTLVNFQFMGIHLRTQRITIGTFQPHERALDEDVNIPMVYHIREELSREDLGRPPIELNRWIPIEIVAEKDLFEFHFDDHLVARYRDEKAGPGTVRFRTHSPMLAHLDDVSVSGPRIPNIGGPHGVAPEARLATTWGKIKDPSRR